MNHARFDSLGELEDAPDIAREDRRRQSITYRIGNPQRFIEITRANDREHRPEYFFAGDLHFRLSFNDGWRIEEAALQTLRLHHVTAGAETRLLLAARFDVARDARHGAIINQRPHLNARLRAWPDAKAGGALD